MLLIVQYPKSKGSSVCFENQSARCCRSKQNIWLKNITEVHLSHSDAGLAKKPEGTKESSELERESRDRGGKRRIEINLED